MDNKENQTAWQKLRPTKRRLVQLYAALLYNAHLRGFLDGTIYTGHAKAACVPGFNCYSCPAAAGACPLGALQNALAASGSRTGFYVFGILMLYGLMLGRTICGWLCPFGLIQELLHRIPTPKIPKNRITRVLSYLKYIILAVFAGAVPLWYGLKYHMAVPGFCKYICPAGTLEGAMGLLSHPHNADYFGMLGILFIRKFIIMLLIGLVCIFCYRSFCRFLCPLGAVYSLFSKIALVGVKKDVSRCNECGACVRSCGMDVRRAGDHECIHCGKCMDVCSQKALSFRAGKVTLISPDGGCADNQPDAETKRQKYKKTAWGIALAVLAFALVWFNFLDPSLKTTSTPAADPPAQSENTGEAAAGFEVGSVLPDFEITCTDGSVFRLSEQRGRIVVINLWATWCGPCVQELPHFDAFYAAHQEDAAVIAVHSPFVTDDVGAFLSDKGYTMPFAVDSEEQNIVWPVVGGNTTLPQTIILDRNGIVVYNQRGSVTPELLESLYEQAAK